MCARDWTSERDYCTEEVRYKNVGNCQIGQSSVRQGWLHRQSWEATITSFGRPGPPHVHPKAYWCAPEIWTSERDYCNEEVRYKNVGHCQSASFVRQDRLHRHPAPASRLVPRVNKACFPP